MRSRHDHDEVDRHSSDHLQSRELQQPSSKTSNYKHIYMSGEQHKNPRRFTMLGVAVRQSLVTVRCLWS